MKRKLNLILNVVLLVILCLTVFSGCTQKKVDPWEVESSLDWVGHIVKAMYGWIGSYGWTVVVFTVFLKILMLPLDFWQRLSGKKMSAKMQMMQPYIAEIDKRYGADSQKGAEEKQKLFKKHGYNMTSSCLPMIITMAVFMTMFGGLRSYSTYNSVQMFNALSQTYYQTYAEQIVNKTPETDAERKAHAVFVDAYTAVGGKLVDGKYSAQFNKAEYNNIAHSLTALQNEATKLKASSVDADKTLGNELTTLIASYSTAVTEAIQTKYSDMEEGWLWIQNIAQPDTWEAIFPQYDSGSNSFTSFVDMSNFGGETNGKELYNTIRDAVLQTGDRGEKGTWNGLMILPILSVGLSFLSMFVSQAMEKSGKKDPAQQQTSTEQQQQQSNKATMIMMPLMMAYFGFIYTGAFGIYMVVNYLISILSTIALKAPVEKMVQKDLAKIQVDSGKASYMR
jgi:YidC/Oxa1 family membrane protein insertase